MDRVWKIIERSAAVVGTACTVLIAYYTIALYYGWNQPGNYPLALPVMNAPWFMYALGGIGVALLITAWLMILLRRGKDAKTAAPMPAVQTEDYSDDPEAEAPDKQAYKEILAFALDRVIPACETQVELQKEIISQASSPNSVLAALANMGLQHSDKTTGFWSDYVALSAGLLASPGPLIKFDAIIEHIAELERGNYRLFSEQMNEFAVIFSLNVRTNASLKPLWLKWVEAHNALIEAYEPIKRDPRFGKLLRPARPSRWGDHIQADQEQGQITTRVADTSEQTIEILFEPASPYQTSEISNGRGLSTIRIGLKAVGRTFVNCKVYIEKIAPQPPMPGGLPIVLAGDAPMLRPDDPAVLIDVASHWNHVSKYRFSALLPWHDVQLTYIDDEPPRLIEIKIAARTDAGEFIKTATFKIWVDEAKKLYLQRQ